MKKKIVLKITLLLLVCLSLANCVEPYQLQSNTFEDALVVEATITNEMKNQEIKISRTYRLEENGPTFEAGADVFVTDDLGNNFEFGQMGDKYVSATAFQAVSGRQYMLHITTADGKSYTSANETLSHVSSIESVTTNMETKDGIRGVQISVNSFDPTGNSKYYRYKYEETYKIVVPRWSELKATVILDDLPGLSGDDIIELTPRGMETRTCYSTAYSDRVYLTSTNGLSEDRVVNFPVRFISHQDPIIANRYSIKVTQYIQNLASYTFYKTLNEIAGSGGSLLSQNQPGFFYGNLSSVNNPEEKVIGFFEVSSVAEKRIFFDFEEVFPDDPQPPYFSDCVVRSFDSTLFSLEDNQGAALRNYILNGSMIYYNNAGPIYQMVVPECGDCTSFSSNVIPPFWE